MNAASDERFHELAMKLVSFECSAEEKAELRRIIDQNPGRREELQKLCLSVGIARELLPLATALEATEGSMSVGEMQAFKAALARRRDEERRKSSTPAPGSSGGGSDEPSVIDAQVIPDKPINGYKIGFYALLLFILIAGSVVLLKSCVPTKNTPSADTVLSIARRPNGVDEPTPAAPAVIASSAETQPQETSPSQGKPTRTHTFGTAPQSKLPSYHGSKWVKLLDENSKPGFIVEFKKFVFPLQEHPILRGGIGATGQRWDGPKSMLLQLDGSRWEAQSFPSVTPRIEFSFTLDADRMVMGWQNFGSGVYLIDKNQVRELDALSGTKCVAGHVETSGKIFIHCLDEIVFEIEGGKVTRLARTDPSNYVHRDGAPTRRHRAFVHSIDKTDAGDTMGIHYHKNVLTEVPDDSVPAALVRFNGKLWEEVCSLGQSHPDETIHYLSKNSLVASAWTSMLVVKEGVANTLASPNEFEALKTARWVAVRAASTEDFVCVDTFGGVYRFFASRFNQVVAPMSSFQGSDRGGLFSVMIARDGTIYGIHNPSGSGSSVIYQLVPK